MIAPVVLVAVNYYTKEKEVIPLLSPFMLLACMSRKEVIWKKTLKHLWSMFPGLRFSSSGSIWNEEDMPQVMVNKMRWCREYVFDFWGEPILRWTKVAIDNCHAIWSIGWQNRVLSLFLGILHHAAKYKYRNICTKGHEGWTEKLIKKQKKCP